MEFVHNTIGYLVDHPGILVAMVLMYVFIYVLSTLFSTPRPGPNPFAKDSARPPAPLVTDRAARDKVLKQGFAAKKVPENLDAIVVGSGIGGLGAAAMLSKAGKRTLVLDQHDQAGGCCHTFVEKGFEFDVGIHYIGQMACDSSVAKILVDQVTDGQLTWDHLIEEFDVVALGEPGKQKKYGFHCGGREPWKKAMLEKFPDEEKALDKYLQLLKEVRTSTMGHIMLKFMPKWMARLLTMTGAIHLFTKYFRYSHRSLQEVVDELTDNQDLRAVLCYSFGDYGCLPRHSSFAMHATLINHYLYGASYPHGGASEIAFHVIPLIEREGGKVLVRARVSKILADSSGKVNGVRVEKGGGSIDIHAPLVISDAGVINTFMSLLPKEIAVKSDMYKLIGKKVDSGFGCMSLFVGLKGTAEELGLKPQNIWAFTGNNLSQLAEDYLEKTGDEVAESEVPVLFVSFPSSKDTSYQERYPGKTVCTVVSLANWRWFADWENKRVMKRGEDYEIIKNAIGRRMWEQALALFPQLRDKVEYFEVGTPVTNKHYIASPRGEIYGLDHTTQRFGSPDVLMKLRPETGIPGLVLTGQDVFSCGFMGALFGGMLCASKVLNRNLWEDLLKLRKDIIKTK